MTNEKSLKFINSEWPAFAGNVRTRLINGAEAYGDKSHGLPDDQLLTEVQQELEDVAGWAAILWAKLERLKVRESLCSSAPTAATGKI